MRILSILVEKYHSNFRISLHKISVLNKINKFDLEPKIQLKNSSINNIDLKKKIKKRIWRKFK